VGREGKEKLGNKNKNGRRRLSRKIKKGIGEEGESRRNTNRKRRRKRRVGGRCGGGDRDGREEGPGPRTASL
jgi:hypothetical protein